MAETHSNTDQLTALAELDRLLTEHRLPYWLFGGWAVDFHVGRVTREHADIDVAVWIDDRIRLAELLSDAGWTHQPEIGEDDGRCVHAVRDVLREERGRATETPEEHFTSDALGARTPPGQVRSRKAVGCRVAFD